MKNKFNFIIGIVASLLVSAIIIYSIENNHSFVQIFLGFISFIFPAIFITSFKSKVSVFLLSTTVIIVAYVIYKFSFLDFIIGVVLAIISGGAISYYRVSKANVFKK
jgi:hypothetical protein|tara:strand:- start:161 stop:481 length:321 start_codon:yes stop_codon:yes gene_type:complete